MQIVLKLDPKILFYLNAIIEILAIGYHSTIGI